MNRSEKGLRPISSYPITTASATQQYKPVERSDDASSRIWSDVLLSTKLEIEGFNATSHIHREVDHQQIFREFQTTFRSAAHETLEPGMESEFVAELAAGVEKYGTRAVLAIASIILTDQAKPHVAAEALRWIGDLHHQESRLLRLKVLETCLRHPSRWIRDGAALGLDGLADSRAIPALREAVARERLPELRKDLQSVLIDLEQVTLGHATIPHSN